MSSATIVFGKKNIRVNTSGVTPTYERVRNSPVAYGSFITDGDVSSRSRVTVLGSRAAERLFGDSIYPIGETIKINNVPFKVIGVLASKGGTGGPGGGNQDDVVMVPLSTAQQRLFPRFRSARRAACLGDLRAGGGRGSHDRGH